MISLIDEISYMAPPAPLISQYDDINPDQFCNGDNRPADCGPNCMCTHKVDIPLNAVVEVVMVDEGKLYNPVNIVIIFYFCINVNALTQLFLTFSTNRKLISSVPLTRICIQCYWYRTVTGPER